MACDVCELLETMITQETCCVAAFCVIKIEIQLAKTVLLFRINEFEYSVVKMCVQQNYYVSTVKNSLDFLCAVS